MPIYEYRCQACEQVSSVLVRSISAKLKPKCEHCGSTRMKRMMSRLSPVKSQNQVMDDLGMPGAA